MTYGKHSLRCLTGLMIGICLLAAATEAAAQGSLPDHWVAYNAAVDAGKRGEWRESLSLMNAALRYRSEEGQRVRTYGLRWDPYFPRFHIGMAYFMLSSESLRNCQAALGVFAFYNNPDLSWFRDLGENEGFPAQSMDNAIATCNAQIAAFSDSTAAAQQRISAAESAARRARDEETKNAGMPAEWSQAWRTKPALGPRLRSADDALENARNALNSGEESFSPTDIDRAERQAALALEGYEEILRSAASIRGDMPPPQPDPVLAAAVVAFYDARFEETLESLRSANFAGRSDQLYAALFRAAANYRLYERGGQSDRALLQAAQTAVQSCRIIDPDFVPRDEYFSPKFRAFYGDITG